MERLTERNFRLGFDDSRRLPSYEAIYERLRKYENLEEDNKLKQLPCEVGSRVYMIYRFLDEGAWEIEEHKIKLEDLENIGETVFLTRKEAEKAIENK